MFLPSRAATANAAGGLDPFGTPDGGAGRHPGLSGFCERAPAACEPVATWCSSPATGSATASPSPTHDRGPRRRAGGTTNAAVRRKGRAAASRPAASQPPPAADPDDYASPAPSRRSCEAAIRTRPLEDKEKAGAAPSDRDPTMTGAVGQALLMMAMPGLLEDRRHREGRRCRRRRRPANLPIPQPAPRT